ncbi:MAG: pyridoxal phosphate-dependent aminotransferase [Thermodesulfobacteriota bacterium]
MPISRKMQGFAERSSWIRKMFEEGTRLKAQYGAANVFDFSLGNPDLPPPPALVERLRELVAREAPGVHGYMPNAGFPYVRAAVAEQVSREQAVALTGDDVLLTCGAAGGLNVVFKTLLDPEDEVLVPVPYFVEYDFYVDNHGGRLVKVPTRPDFSLDLGAMAAAIGPRTKAVLVNSPNNPTGQIYDAGSLAELARLLTEASQRQGSPIYLVADEPYRKIVFDGAEVPPVLASYPASILVSSSSKDLSVPGERIGYIAVHPAMPDRAALLGGLTLANRILGFVNAPALQQRLLASLAGVSVDAGIYQRRRDVLCAMLAAAGYEFQKPRGAFYLFPRSPLADDVAFVGFLRDQRVLAVPGRGFGAPGFFRLAFCVDETVIQRAEPGFRAALAAAKGGGA